MLFSTSPGKTIEQLHASPEVLSWYHVVQLLAVLAIIMLVLIINLGVMQLLERRKVPSMLPIRSTRTERHICSRPQYVCACGRNQTCLSVRGQSTRSLGNLFTFPYTLVLMMPGAFSQLPHLYSCAPRSTTKHTCINRLETTRIQGKAKHLAEHLENEEVRPFPRSRARNQKGACYGRGAICLLFLTRSF